MKRVVDSGGRSLLPLELLGLELRVDIVLFVAGAMYSARSTLKPEV